ncbi:MAG: glycosyltransferase family 4 protein [Candidatus Helarchaeota archaeon]
MRILFLLPQLEKGGGQVIQALELAKFLKKNNHSVIIISDRSKKISKDGLEYLKYLDIHLIGKKSYNYLLLIRYVSLFFAFLKVFRKKRIDLIQIFDPHLGGLIGTLIKKIFEIPLVIRIGAKYNEYYENKIEKMNLIFRNQIFKEIFHILLEKFEMMSLKNSDIIISNCQFIKKYILSKGYIQNHKKVRVIPSGVSLNYYKSDGIQNKEKIRENRYLLYVGRIVYYKGLNTLIDAFKRVLSNYKTLKLILIGSTEIDEKYFKKLKEKIEIDGLEKHIIFKGSVPHNDVYHYLKNAEVLILPSIKGMYSIEEGLPNVILEAFKMKCPVIASNIGGINEIIKDKETGLLIEPSNTTQLVNKILLLLKNDDLRGKIIKNARQYLLQNRNINTIYEKYLKVYKKLTS